MCILSYPLRKLYKERDTLKDTINKSKWNSQKLSCNTQINKQTKKKYKKQRKQITKWKT